jgi:hypothetical protein
VDGIAGETEWRRSAIHKIPQKITQTPHILRRQPGFQKNVSCVTPPAGSPAKPRKYKEYRISEESIKPEIRKIRKINFYIL